MKNILVLMQSLHLLDQPTKTGYDITKQELLEFADAVASQCVNIVEEHAQDRPYISAAIQHYWHKD
jgi:hypothetical protein